MKQKRFRLHNIFAKVADYARQRKKFASSRFNLHTQRKPKQTKIHYERASSIECRFFLHLAKVINWIFRLAI